MNKVTKGCGTVLIRVNETASQYGRLGYECLNAVHSEEILAIQFCDYRTVGLQVTALIQVDC